MQIFALIWLFTQSSYAFHDGARSKLIFTNQTYYTVETNFLLSFIDAKLYCQSFGEKLAQPNTKDEFDFIISKFGGIFKSFWLGFSAIDKFEYVSDDNKYFQNQSIRWGSSERCYSGYNVERDCCAIEAGSYSVRSEDCHISKANVICEGESTQYIESPFGKKFVAVVGGGKSHKNFKDASDFCATFDGGKLVNPVNQTVLKWFQDKFGFWPGFWIENRMPFSENFHWTTCQNKKCCSMAIINKEHFKIFMSRIRSPSCDQKGNVICEVKTFTRKLYSHISGKTYYGIKYLKKNFIDAENFCLTNYRNSKLAEIKSNIEFDWLRDELYDWKSFMVDAKNSQNLEKSNICIDDCCGNIVYGYSADNYKHFGKSKHKLARQICDIEEQFVCETEPSQLTEYNTHAILITVSAIGVIAVIIFLTIIVIKCRRNQIKKQTLVRTYTKPAEEQIQGFVESLDEPVIANIDGEASNVIYIDVEGDYITSTPTIDKIELDKLQFKDDFLFPAKNVIIKEQLGEGFFGKVMLAEAVGLELNVPRTLIAVKMLKNNSDEKQLQALEDELKIMMHVGRHLNIVNLLGAVRKDSGELLVMIEFCKFGNLREFLMSKRENFVDMLDGNKSCPDDDVEIANNEQLTTTDLIVFAFQIATGMEFLWSKKLVHRDLAARNVLVGNNKVVKICDFGLAKDICKYQYYRQKSEMPLPLKWMAIESLCDGEFTTKSDVWSFGITVWEIFSLGEMPFPFSVVDLHFLELLKDGNRMSRPERCPQGVYEIMTSCWETNPKDRPDFTNLNQLFGDLLEDVVKKPYRVLQKVCEETIYQTGPSYYANLQT